MKSKTVIAFAVASACAWPLVTSAHDSAQHDRFTRQDQAMIDTGSFEIATPLSVNEAGPAEYWTGFDAWAHPRDHERLSSIESSRGAVMTAPADNETSLSTEGGMTMNGSARDDVALANPDTYSGYLVEVPAQTDYYIVESQPSWDESTAYILEPSSSTYDVVLVPYDSAN